MINPRKIAVKALTKIEIDRSYSNLTLNSLFKDIDITKEDKSFVTALVYGVLERKITIDYLEKSHYYIGIYGMTPYSLGTYK